MNHYNQNQSKDNKNIKKVVFGTVVTAMAALTLAACGNTNASATKNSSDTSPKTSQQEKNPTSATPEGSNANGNITNTPTTITQFEDTVEAAGFTIIPGTDNDGKQISGAAKEDDGSFYTNVEVGNYDGTVSYSDDTWLVNSSDGKVNSGNSSSITGGAAYFQSQEGTSIN